MKFQQQPTVTHIRRGVTVIELLTVIAIVGLLLSLIAPAVMVIRERARHVECLSRLKQIGIALHSFEVARGYFPTTSEPFPGYLDGLQRLVPNMENSITTLICPADQRASEARRFEFESYHQNDGTRFRRFDRNGFTSDRDSQPLPNILHDTKAAEITDGLSHTAAVSEQLIANPSDAQLSEAELRADPHRYFWYTSRTYPSEVALATACDADRQSPYPLPFVTVSVGRLGYDHILPPNQIGCINGPYSGPLSVGNAWEAALPASSQHRGYVNVLIADGAVRSVADHVDVTVWRALGTRAGAESVGLE